MSRSPVFASAAHRACRCVLAATGRPGVAHFCLVEITPGAVSPEDVTAARKLIIDVISDTPLLHSRVLSEAVGGPVFLKCENLQRTGSFKVRGAYNRIARLAEAERARGVVAASAGNHSQGVAFAAGRLGCAATVFMPAGAPLPKVQATRGYGAEVILHGTCVEDAVAEATAFAERTGAVFIHPYDHPDIVAGQGTVGLEVVEQCPPVRTVVVPAGGGGRGARRAGARARLRPAGGGGALRRQHRPAAAVQAAPPRPQRGRPLPGLPLPAARSSGVAGQAPRRPGRPRRERARGEPRTTGAAAARRRG